MKVCRTLGSACALLFLLALALGAIAPSATATRAAEGSSSSFVSPTRNIHCRYFPSTTTIGCATLNNRIEVMMSLRSRPYAQPVSHTFPIGPTLGYGSSHTIPGRFRCTSRTTGMSCTSVISGYCFTIAREGQSLSCGSPVTSNTSSRRAGCDPSYPTVCIPPPPPDLDCGQISYTDFRVVGSDPHGFDGDNDGVGCESTDFSNSSPAAPSSSSSGATAKCRDGTYSYARSHRGACSHHGGVAVWYR